MSFFGEEPQVDGGHPDPNFDEGAQLPVVAAVLPIDLVLARSDAAALALRSVRARPTGIEVSLTAYWRTPQQVNASWSGTVEYPAVGNGDDARAWTKRFPRGWGREDEVDENGELRPGYIRFGFRFADGTAISNVSYMAWRLKDRTAVPSVGMSGSGGHGRGSGPGSCGVHEARYWLWPLPPLPSMDIIAAWPAFDVAETVTSLDTQPLHDAAARAELIWTDWKDLDPSRFQGAWQSFE